MKRVLLLRVLIAAIGFAGIMAMSILVVRYIDSLLIISKRPTTVITLGTGNDLFHVIPENALDGAIIIDAKGKRHYVFSREQLRLLGPKFLAEMAGDK